MMATFDGIMKQPFAISADVKNAGEEMHAFMRDLFPMHRSITGAGTLETLKAIGQRLPIMISEVASGTRVFDWTIPKEWEIRDAYIKNSKGEKVVDLGRNNLHVVNYSASVRATMALDELKKNIFTLPDHPEWIPYLTTYYKEAWGFCMAHAELEKLSDGAYDVVVDSEFHDGALRYGEVLIKGASTDEVLISSYICHPSMCNDGLSGIVLAAKLAEYLQQFNLRYSYRFLFIPETIGAIAWLSRNEDAANRVRHGLVATCVGDSGSMTYKRSRRGNAEIDHAVRIALRDSGSPHCIIDFDPARGSDERQFCSPGFNLPVGSLMRSAYAYLPDQHTSADTPHAHFPEYHTSADTLEVVQAAYLSDSFRKYLDVIFILEHNGMYESCNPKGEPQLGKRGLFRSLGAQKTITEMERAMWWVLSFADGDHSLLDIADRSDVSFSAVKATTDILCEHQLVRRVKKGASL